MKLIQRIVRLAAVSSLITVATFTARPLIFKALTQFSQLFNRSVTKHSRLFAEPNCTATEFRDSKVLYDNQELSYISSRAAQRTRVASGNSVSSRKDTKAETFISMQSLDSLPVAYVITPTYNRNTQTADLLRLCYTLKNVPRVHWIVVEDSNRTTQAVAELLADCKGPSVTHLAVKKPAGTKHRGVQQRNIALQWIYDCVRPGPHAGGVYFADDDNTYDLKVFEAVRWTETVSVWLVGLAGNALYEGPVCSNGKVIGWQGIWGRGRKFPLDMAAFSIGVNFLLQRTSTFFLSTWAAGTLETNFIQSLKMSRETLHPEPDSNCSRILAWHTRTQKAEGAKTPLFSNATSRQKGKMNKTSLFSNATNGQKREDE